MSAAEDAVRDRTYVLIEKTEARLDQNPPADEAEQLRVLDHQLWLKIAAMNTGDLVAIAKQFEEPLRRLEQVIASAGKVSPTAIVTALKFAIQGAFGIGDAGGNAAPPSQPASSGGTGGTGGTGDMAADPDANGHLSDRVPIPPRANMNVGLTACSEATVLDRFGRPGELTEDCSSPTGDFLARVVRNVNVGPFKVSGLDYAVESLRQVFDEVRQANPTLIAQLKTEGMLCVRHRRHNPTRFSNHSWGTAIDLYFGNAVVDQGERVTHRGNLLLAPYFNKHGWYWGAGFSGDSVDSMHFELAEETILKIPKAPLNQAPLNAPGPAVAPAGFAPGGDNAAVLGNIVELAKAAAPIAHNFRGVTRLAKLPEGQLIFSSELQLDTDGWPGGGDLGESTWQADTSLNTQDGKAINANEVPYFVLPGLFYKPHGIKLGDVAAVVFGGKLAFAVFADVGPETKLGEGSLQLLRLLGAERLRPDGTVINAGMGNAAKGQVATTIVFPGSKANPGYKNQAALLDYIQTKGQSLFQKLKETPVA